tara:strand:+ start:75 stop:293 length:219 start_codon:yes stop_codon:yes gene_type:complete
LIEISKQTDPEWKLIIGEINCRKIGRLDYITGKRSAGGCSLIVLVVDGGSKIVSSCLSGTWCKNGGQATQQN